MNEAVELLKEALRLAFYAEDGPDSGAAWFAWAERTETFLKSERVNPPAWPSPTMHVQWAHDEQPPP